ncbi:MAG: hypothetical protein ACYDA2_04110 [Acidimicrobiales bacterium]
MSLLRDGAPGTAGLDGDGATRAELEEERDFLLRSLTDLDAERAAGDISDTDYRALRDRYTARAASLTRTLRARSADLSPTVAAPAPERTPRRRSRRLVWGAVVLFAAAAAVLVAGELSKRLPGQPATGSVRLDPTRSEQQSLAQAQALEQQGDEAGALSLYQQILRRDPGQEQALAESGWLEFEAGVAAKNATLLGVGQRDEQAAERADGADYAPHLYLASMALVEGEAATAVAEYDLFLADGPPTTVVQSAWPYIVRAFDSAGRTPPSPPPGVHS